MARITKREVPEYINTVSKEASMLLEKHLQAYFRQETSRERVVENMNRYIKLAIRTLDEALDFVGSDDDYF